MISWAIKRRDGQWYTGTSSPKDSTAREFSDDKDRRFEWDEKANAEQALRILFTKGEAALIRITRTCSPSQWIDAKDMLSLVDYVDEMVFATREAREFRSALIASVRKQARAMLQGKG
jgi:hypothetical protein